jgi:predicted RNase H-related nuclease YkuK (DUF458 family)
MKFKKLMDNNTVEISEYVKQYIIDHKFNNLRIYVGCDSHNKGEFTTYVTTLVIHIGDTGCHVLFNKDKVKRINDLWTRLWKEVELSVELALYLRENGINIHNIDLDLNDDEAYASNKLVAAAKGYVQSLGIKPRIKPDLLPAVHAADNLSKI